MAHIEIDGLPINSMVNFHGYVSQNQMVKIDDRWRMKPWVINPQLELRQAADRSDSWHVWIWVI